LCAAAGGVSGSPKIGLLRNGVYNTVSTQNGFTNVAMYAAYRAGRTSSARVTLQAYGGEVPTVQGGLIINDSYVTLRGLKIDLYTLLGNTPTPFRVSDGTSTSNTIGFELDQCEVYGNTAGTDTAVQAMLLGSSVSFANSVKATRTIFHHLQGTVNTNPVHGIYASHTDGLQILGNLFYLIGTTTTTQGQGGRASQIYPSSTNVTFAYNTVDSATAGPVFGNDGAGTSSWTGHTEHHNIYANTDDGGRGVAVLTTTGVLIAGDVQPVSGPDHFFNNVNGNANAKRAGSFTTSGTDTNGDPLFINRAGRDYRLGAGSPAAGKGFESYVYSGGLVGLPLTASTVLNSSTQLDETGVLQ
jgi:hypothetical protein